MVRDYPLVLLAGGKGSRVGMPKGLVRVEGRCWLEWQIERFPGSRVIVVIGHHADAYLSAFPNLEFARSRDPEAGPFASVQAGIAAAGAAPGVFVLPVDVPSPAPATWLRLAQAEGEAVQPVWEGRAGHPILLRSPCFEAILARDPRASRLDKFLRERHPTRVPGDPRIHRNLNTAADWTASGLSCDNLP